MDATIDTQPLNSDLNLKDVNNTAIQNSEKIIKFPLTRVKTIIKQDPDVTLASQDAVIVIAKATELFIETFTREAYSHLSQSKRKTLQKKDLEATVQAIDALAFLEGTGDF